MRHLCRARAVNLPRKPKDQHSLHRVSTLVTSSPNADTHTFLHLCCLVVHSFCARVSLPLMYEDIAHLLE